MAADTHTIKKQAGRHVALACIILMVLMALSWAVMSHYGIMQHYRGAAISALFCFASALAYSTAWKKIMISRPTAITKFYLASSGVRLLAAAAVLLVYCLAVRDRDIIIGFSVTFLAFYFIMLIFDSIYYARIERANNQTTKQ